jgi:hypothetical protein
LLQKKYLKIYAEVVTRVAGSLEAVGLPRYPEKTYYWPKKDTFSPKIIRKHTTRGFLGRIRAIPPSGHERKK